MIFNKGWYDEFFRKIYKTFTHFLNITELVKLKFSEAFLVFIFGQLLVENTVVFIAQINTPKTIAAIAAIQEKCGICAMVALLRIEQTITTKAVNAFKT